MKVHHKIARIPLGVRIVLFGILITAIGAPLISNNRPIVVWDSAGWSFPVFGADGNILDDYHTDAYFILHPPIPYLPGDIDLDRAGQAPMAFPNERPWYFVHWLGTDEIGRDVLAQLIYGCRSSVLIAMGAMAIALLIGLTLGALGGYWHKRRIGISLPVFSLIVVLLPVALNTVHVAGIHLSTLNTVVIALLTAVGFGLLIGLFHYWIERISEKAFRTKPKRIHLPFYPDQWVLGLTNFFTTIPGYFALLAFLAIWPQPNAASISLALGLLMWPDITRLTRSAIIQLRQTGLAEAAEGLGYSPNRVLFIHLLPNALQPALVALGFGIGGAIMAESFLSFIGIAPAEMVSWGTLLAKTRSYPQMWWLSVFPGIAIFVAALVFYRLANTLEKPIR